MKAQKWDWKAPDYSAVFKLRMENLKNLELYPERVPILKRWYRDHPADFIHDWGVTYDPRNAERGLPTLIPFLLFPKQRDWIDWVLDQWTNQKPGLCEKSRDMGVTWLAVSLSCTLCLFNDGMAIGFGSRKTEYVDKVGTMKPILPKGRMFMEHIPPQFRGSWTAWRDAPFMRISFPDTGSIITGEGGDDIGRGDRSSIFFVDEAQPLYSKVLTPSGWLTMGDMRIGTAVISKNGKPTRVTHINEAGIHEVFRLTFSDGTFTDASPNHLWDIEKVVGKRENLTLRTYELAENFAYESPGGKTLYRYRVPYCDPVEFNPVSELPLNPYVLGALLGDGSMASGVIRLTSADAEIVDEVRRLLPAELMIGAFDGRYTHNIVDRRGRIGRATGGDYPRSLARETMAVLGLKGCRSSEKFIPESYKMAAPADRLHLLQGLMDTDGYAETGRASFHTSSRTLAEDVRFLVQSLGGTAYWNVKPDARGYKDQYALQIVMPPDLCPFRLSRKRDRMRPRKAGGRTIVSVIPIGRMPVRCITVDAPDGLYLTDNFIVTHNSAHLERPDLIEASLSQTTNCRIDMSSVRGMANPFATKRWGGKINVFIFDWRDDPRKDDEWYAEQQEKLDPVVVAQEIDRDYSASVTGIVIPGAWVRAAIDAREKLGIAPSGLRGMALDVADEGLDKNAIAEIHGMEIVHTEERSGKGGDLYSTTEWAFEVCDDRGYPGFRYDADGLGAGVRGDARVINERRAANGARGLIIVGFRGSEAVFDPDGIVDGTIGYDGDPGRTNQDYFGNHKAQGWWAVRKRFQKTHRWVVDGVPCAPDDIISLSSKNPNLMKLVAELSQPTYRTNEVGKIIIEKKPNGMKSPNMADAVMIRYAPMEQVPVPITGDMLAQIARAGAMTRRRY